MLSDTRGCDANGVVDIFITFLYCIKLSNYERWSSSGDERANGSLVYTCQETQKELLKVIIMFMFCNHRKYVLGILEAIAM